jgi:hypothetical protein
MSLNQLQINALSVAKVLASVAIAFVIASLAGQIALYFTEHRNLLGFVPFFYLDQEVGITTFFHVSILFMASVPLWFIYLYKKAHLDSYSTRWAILSLGFMLMAYDLATGLHRKLTPVIHSLLGSSKNLFFHASNNLGIFRYAWVIPYLIIAIVCCIYFFKFWLSLPKRTRINFLVSAILLLSGALGFELIEGSYTAIHGEENFVYGGILVTIDKSLQMSGIIYFIYGQLEYIADTFKDIKLSFE